MSIDNCFSLIHLGMVWHGLRTYCIHIFEMLRPDFGRISRGWKSGSGLSGFFLSGQMSLSWEGFMESLFVVWKSRAQHESEAVLPKSRMSALRRTAEDRRNLNDGRPAKRRDIRWSQMFRTAHSFWALSVDKRLWP